MFSILIPTYNNLEYLKVCLRSLKKNSKGEFAEAKGLRTRKTSIYFPEQNEYRMVSFHFEFRFALH